MIPSSSSRTTGDSEVYQRGLVIDSQHTYDDLVKAISVSKGIGD